MEDEELRLPLETRWTHAKWQVRQSAYKDTLEQVERGNLTGLPLDPANLREAATDANVVALDTGIRLVTKYVSKCDATTAIRIRSNVFQSLAEKGLGAVKPSVKTAAGEAVLTFVANADPEGTVSDLIELLGKKLPPKMLVQLLNAVAQIFTEFGSPIVDPKPVIQYLPPFFAHTDKNVRSSAASLSVSLSRWVKPAAMSAALGELKPALLKDLERQWQSAGPPQPTRLTRNQAAQADNGDEDLNDASLSRIDEESADDKESEESDHWDVVPETEVLSKIPPSFETAISSTKWKERKEALDEVVPLLNKPKLASGDYTMLVSALERVLAKDTNQMCAGLAVQGVRSLVTGLRSEFRKYAPRVVPPLVERFKEKKPTFVEGINGCLDMLLRWSSFDVLVGPLLAGASHKTPAVKLEATRYLARMICEIKELPPRGELVNIASVAVKLLGDPQEPIRKAGTQVLGAVLKICGPQPLSEILSKLYDTRRARIDDAAAQTTVKVASSKPAGKRMSNNRSAPQVASNKFKAVPPSMPPPSVPRATGAGMLRSSVLKDPPRPPPRMSPPQPPRPSQDDFRSPLRHKSNKNETSSPLAIGSPVPRFSSTPKLGSNKRTLQNSEITPARQPPPAGRRRLVSPARSQDRLRSDTMPPPTSAPVIPQDFKERLNAAEAKISEQQREISDLKLQLMISRDELASLRQKPIADADQMSSRLTKMSLERKSAGSRQQIVPITRYDEPDTSSTHSSDDWQRVIAQTNELKQRVLRLRTERERARVN